MIKRQRGVMQWSVSDYLLYSKACDISYFLVFESIEYGHILTTNNALDYIILIKRILEDYILLIHWRCYAMVKSS
jgi:hypothetical protein